MRKRSRESRRYEGVLAPSTPAKPDDPDALGPVTPEGRLVYALVAGVANTFLALVAAGITGLALGFAGFGSGGGWEPVAIVSLAGWLGGLSGVLAMTRNLFLGQRLPIGSVVGACVVATIVTFAAAWGLVGGGLIAFLLVACASAAAAYVVTPAG